MRTMRGSPIDHVSSYIVGRTLSYGSLGALVGTLGNTSMFGPARPWLRLAAELAVAFALAKFGVRLARAGARAPVADGGQAPVTLRPRRSRLRSISGLVDRGIGRLALLVPRAPFALGVSTALFPCGALGGALLFSASTASPLEAAASMAVFALTSAPILVFAVLAGSSFSSLLSKALPGQPEKARGSRAFAMRAFRWLVSVALVATATRITITALGAVIS